MTDLLFETKSDRSIFPGMMNAMSASPRDIIVCHSSVPSLHEILKFLLSFVTGDCNCIGRPFKTPKKPALVAQSWDSCADGCLQFASHL